MSALAPGERVWVPASETAAGAPAEDDNEAPLFTLGVVQAPGPDSPAAPQPGMVLVCLVEEGDGSEVLWARAASLIPANPETLDGAEDIGTLSHLNEPSLLRVIASRYAARSIYTRAGPVLVALNPFCKVAGLYDPRMMAAYQRAAAAAAAAEPADGPPLPPHLYQVAGAAYYDMTARGRSQSVVINGESGAGKTESAKIILSFFISASAGAAGRGGSARVGEALQAELSASNVLLEAFGNAKTTRNHNSSRFGKLLSLRFSPAGALSGGSIARFLLEKSRVVSPEVDERTYHAFYQLASLATGGGGAEAEALREELGLREAAHYRYLTAGACIEVDGVDDHAEWEATHRALAAIYTASPGGEAGSVGEVWRVVAAVMALGNVDFCEPPDEDAEALPPATDAPRGPAGSLELAPGPPCEALRLAGRLLGCGEGALVSALNSRTISAGGDMCVICKKLPEARASRDALAKALYERLFDHVIGTLNASLQAVGAKAGAAGASGGAGIAVLDIFGSEIFATNGFEQLLINFANEKLQAHFTAAAITLLQAEYEREGLAIERVQHADNAATIALLEGRPLSVLALLDDQCLQAGATDASLVTALHSSFADHPAYATPRFGAAASFVIRHFGGDVTYHGGGFLSKNKDALFAELPATMRGSSSRFVAGLFSEATEARRQKPPPGAAAGGRPGWRPGGGGRGRATQFVSVGSQFRDSIASLVATLGATQSHFVRCIKPNEVRGPFLLWPRVAMSQLRCCAVLEAVRVSQAGFPTRIPFSELLSRYAMLRPGRNHLGSPKPRRKGTKPGMHGGGSGTLDDAGEAPHGGSRLREETSELLQGLRVASEDYMLGKTLVFLRTGVLAKCEAARARHLGRCFASVQARLRGRVCRRSFQDVRNLARALQRALRRKVQRREAARLAAESAAAAAAAAAAAEASARARTEAAAADASAEAQAGAVAAVAAEAQVADEQARLRAKVEQLCAQIALSDAQPQRRVPVCPVEEVATPEREAPSLDEVAELEEQVQELKDEMADAVAERDEFEEHNVELQNRCVMYEEELERLEDENGQLNDSLAVCQRDLAQAKEEQMALFQEVAALRARLGERDSEMNELLLKNCSMMNKLANEGFASPRDDRPSLKRAAISE